MSDKSDKKLYIFELGRLQHLSIAELNSLLGEENFVETIDRFAVFALPPHLAAHVSTQEKAQDLQNKLGGTIKTTEVVDSFPLKSTNPKIKIQKSIESLLKNHFKGRSGKIPFAITTINLPDKTQIFLKFFLSFSKKILKSLGFNSRFVNKPWQNPTSAQIFKSKSVEKGIDISILGGQKTGTLYITKTLAIQDINSYSKRDYKKPFRDARMGMLPPKLSQIMINLAEHNLDKPSNIVFDPFCGSGTILMEALLQSKDVVGSDIDEKAIQGTLQNLYWLVENFDDTSKEFAIFHKDASQLEENDLPTTPDAIVTETHLGPPVSRLPKEENLNKTFSNLTQLHETWLTKITPLITQGTKIVICLPAFRKARREYIRLPDFPSIAKKAGLTILNTEPLIYDRSDQVVAREIVILQK
jgi:tRNA G10  N-methylase Trm11